MKSNTRVLFSILFFAGLFLFIAQNSCCAEVIAKSPNKQVSLIELYTSEGCSSCPEAEQWLSLLSEKPGLWNDFVPAAFHVDYWDSLGWKDNLAQAKFTQRQKEYSRTWNAANTYTPAFVLNGKDWRGWYSSGLPQASLGGGGGSLSIDNPAKNTYKIIFNPQKKVQGAYIAHTVLLASGIFSEVTSGENSGRTLQHDFTVIEHIEKNMKNKGQGNSEADVVLSIPSHISARKWAVAAWITQKDDPTPIQSAGAYLPTD